MIKTLYKYHPQPNNEYLKNHIANIELNNENKKT